MKLETFLRGLAREDLQSAAAWYQQRRDGLGSEFIDEFLSCVDRIENNPELYPVVDADVRRALLRRFPYAIYYIVEPTHIQILGIYHCGQHPDTWRTRA